VSEEKGVPTMERKEMKNNDQSEAIERKSKEGRKKRDGQDWVSLE